jgi:hypothetical protein
MFGFRKSNEGEASEPAPSATDPTGRHRTGDSPSLVPEKMRSQSRKMNLIGNDELSKAIGLAVRSGLERHFVFAESQLNAAVTSIGEELLKNLRSRSRAVRGLPKQAFLQEVEEDKRRIEEQRERARGELGQLLKQLQDRRIEFGKVEQELVREAEATGQVQDRDFAARIEQLFGNTEGAGDLTQIQKQITSLALQTLQEERDKALDKQVSEHRQEVQNFERRISKLSSNLELTEEELRRIAAAKNIDIGVGSIYRTIQGLSNGDSDFETKKELMTSIFEANLTLQKGGAEE